MGLYCGLSSFDIKLFTVTDAVSDEGHNNSKQLLLVSESCLLCYISIRNILLGYV